MKYGSVCSGIEAATVAWHHLGWEPQWFSEIDKFPSRLLSHHYPDTPNIGDMTKIHETNKFNESNIDLLVGGTPCQSFSVAGLRKGLDDPRGNLAIHFLKIADLARPKWVVWENVPSVLSSSKGRDFGAFLGGLGELGYGWAYRVLDAQYFGVAQRRRRVFVVGYLGDWRRAAAVLFERESLSGNTAPSREKGKGTSGGFETGFTGGRFTEVSPTLDTGSKDGPIRNQSGVGVVMPIYGGSDPELCDTVTSKWAKGSGGPSGNECGLFVAQPITFDAAQITSQHNGSNPKPGDPCHTLAKENTRQATICIQDARGIDKAQNGIGLNDSGVAYTVDTHATQGVCVYVHDTLSVGANQTTGVNSEVVSHGMSVRRLTPIECERLQGFPDNYTKIPKAADGPRYKALGNSMAVPVMRWIGERINKVNQI